MSNRHAFRVVISDCEGTPGDEGYRALFGWRPGNGKVFASFADHPRQFFPYKQLDGTVVRTSAAGKYQATATTWDDFIRECGPHDFSPASQDKFADWLITKCGAMPDVDAGRLREAIEKCGGRWASLPSARVPQPRRSYEFCVQSFIKAGGVLAGSTKPTEAPVPIFAALLPTILGLIPQLASIFKPGSEVAQRNVQAATVVANTLVEATQSVNLQEAVEKMQTDPAMKDAAAKAVQAEWYKLSELLEVADKLHGYDMDRWGVEIAGKDAAARRAAGEKWDMTQVVVWFAACTLTLLVLTLLGALVWQATQGTRTIDSGLLGLAGPIMMASVAAWGAIIAYRFDGNKTSEAQNVVISDLAKRRDS
jgi:muramidase (phage lysozyme)